MCAEIPGLCPLHKDGGGGGGAKPVLREDRKLQASPLSSAGKWWFQSDNPSGFLQHSAVSPVSISLITKTLCLGYVLGADYEI